MSFQKATRELRTVIILLQSSSGAGKTKSALRLLKGITNNGKIAVIDTENRSSAIYANEFDFYINDIPIAEQNINGFIAAMEEAKTKVDGVILDGLTPAWKDILEKAIKMGGGFKDWQALTPIQDKFMKYIQGYPIPLICTVRMKQGYTMDTDEKGKARVKKLGLEPIQKQDLSYEFDLVFNIDKDNHKASLDKCRYSEIEEYFNQNNGEILLTEEVGELIRKIIKG